MSKKRLTGRLTEDQKYDVKYRLLDTCQTVGQVLSQMEITTVSAETVIDQMLDVSVEKCAGCAWWLESCSLEFREDRKKPYCEQCWPEGHDN